MIRGAHHLNVNVFGKEKLWTPWSTREGRVRQLHHPRFRLAVKFIDLTREQQLDVLARTCHGVLLGTRYVHSLESFGSVDG